MCNRKRLHTGYSRDQGVTMSRGYNFVTSCNPPLPHTKAPPSPLPPTEQTPPPPLSNPLSTKPFKKECALHLTECQTDKQAERQNARQADRQTDRQILMFSPHAHSPRCTGRMAGRQTDKQTFPLDAPAECHPGRQTDIGVLSHVPSPRCYDWNHLPMILSQDVLTGSHLSSYQSFLFGSCNFHVSKM